jgi:hypothetical protein
MKQLICSIDNNGNLHRITSDSSWNFFQAPHSLSVYPSKKAIQYNEMHLFVHSTDPLTQHLRARFLIKMRAQFLNLASERVLFPLPVTPFKPKHSNADRFLHTNVPSPNQHSFIPVREMGMVRNDKAEIFFLHDGSRVTRYFRIPGV